MVDLVHLVYLVEPNKRDKPDKPNNSLLPLADFISSLLGWEERATYRGQHRYGGDLGET
jgi:hypothetical protein